MVFAKHPEKTSATNRRQAVQFAATLALGGLLILSTPNSAHAFSGPEQHVTKIGNSVIKLANGSSRGFALHKKFERLLSRQANMNSVALFSLGRYRKELPPNLRSRYQKLVKAYIAGLFVYYLGDFKGRTLEIRGSRKSGRSVIVDTRISSSGSSKKVLWRVYSSGGRHRVTDVNIRGIWLSIQMRQKFTQLLKRKKGDFNTLIAFLDEYKNWMPQN